MTNFFREDGCGAEYVDKLNGYTSGNKKLRITGKALALTVCVELQWPWLMYISVLCLLTLVLFLSALLSAYRHRDVAIWKSSLLPTLFFDFRSTNEPRPSGLEMQPHDLAELKNMSMATTAKLGRGGSDAAYSSARRSSTEADGAERRTVSPLSSMPSTRSVSQVASQDHVEAAPVHQQLLAPRIGRKPVPRRE